jgi:hypothetical protein
MAFGLSIRGMCAARNACSDQEVLRHPSRTQLSLGVLLCLPTAPALLPEENGDLGMSPIYGQLSDKPRLAL